MPELPEVETVRRGLAPAMTGRRIVEVVQRRPDLRFALPERFAERLTGRRITHLGRRAKYLMAEIEGGDVLAMHLGMTGRFTIATAKPKVRAGHKQAVGGPAGDRVQLGEFTYDTGHDPAHDHVVFHLEDGVSVTYNDARRFGYMSLIGADELATHPHFASLGVEPLGNELSPAYLAERADGRKADLKAFLMDQRIVAGLGNIYVCETLFRSGLDPKRPARFLARKGGHPTDRAERLVPVIRTVLEAAIDAGGSTLRDYRQADGALGYFQHTFAVYGREGEACAQADCKGTVRRIVQAGRSTFYCPHCQR